MSAVLDQNYSTDYETDFHQWLLDQVALLDSGRFDELDIEHLKEELEGLAASDRRELENRLKVLYHHLLKWRYQPHRRGASWEDTVDEQREQIEMVLHDSPSLRPHLTKFAARTYSKARRKAHKETGLPLAIFPETCEWTIEQVLDENWLPEAAGD